MELLGDYGSSDDDVPAGTPALLDPAAMERQTRQKIDVVVNATPAVDISLETAASTRFVDTKSQMVKYNPMAQQMFAAPVGPQLQSARFDLRDASGRSVNALVERTHVDSYAFENEMNSFATHGVARAADGSALVGFKSPWSFTQEAKRKARHDAWARERTRNNGNSSGDATSASTTSSAINPAKKPKWTQSKSERRAARKRKQAELESAAARGDLDDGLEGIWAPKTAAKLAEEAEVAALEAKRDELKAAADAKRARHDDASEMTEEEANREEAFKYTRGEGPAVPWVKGLKPAECTSIYHGPPGSEVDYQGRSWFKVPKGLKPADEDFDPKAKAFIPKRCVHTWTGHTKGVQTIEFRPRYGDLLLSASHDGKVKIWDTTAKRKRACLQTYMGHQQAVRQVKFDNDGDGFISCSFDRRVKVWDAETGQCTADLGNNKVPYCCTYYPRDNNIVLAGFSNKKILQWDLRTGEMVQEYDHHLAPVNTINFLDDDKRMVTTSDDKKILIWEYNIPVPIKYISEPYMHSVPAVTLHPSKLFFAGQSLDNQIKVWSARDRFREQRKKVFKGHTIAGYACQIGFSPNGQFIMSGDGDGRLWFWNWRNGKVYRKLNCHQNGPCMGAIWHPTEPSKVATCGWDGLIKYWD